MGLKLSKTRETFTVMNYYNAIIMLKISILYNENKFCSNWVKIKNDNNAYKNNIIKNQNIPKPLLKPPLFAPRTAYPLSAHAPPKAGFFYPFNFLLSHLTFMNLHIKVSSTSIMAPSLSKSPIYPGALNMVTSLLFAKNS